MIDLTPLDVRKKRGDFRRILRGYDPGEVDTFLELVEARLEALVMENLSLSEKVQRLTSQLGALEGREKAVQDALVTAQKLREEVQTQSRREADSVKEQATREAESLRDQVQRETESLRGEAHREASILRDEAIREAASVRDHARREAELLRKEVIGEVEARVLEAEGLIKERQRALEEIERSRRKFLKGFRSLLERELDSVEVEESRRPLEDTPLELNLRGWKRAESEGADGAPWGDSGGRDDADLPASPPPGYEPVIDLDQAGPVGDEGQGSPGGWGALPGDEPPEGEFSDIVPVGAFELPPGGEAPTGSDFGPGSPTAEDPEAEGDDAVGPPALQASVPESSGGEGDGGEGEEGGDDPAPSGEPVEKMGPLPGDEVDDAPDPQKVDAAFGSTVNEILGSRTGSGVEEPSEPLWLSSLLEQEGVGDRSSMEGRSRGTANDVSPNAGYGDVGEGAGNVTEEDDEEEPRID